MSDTSGRELYSNDEGTPVLKQSFVLYLDELGTSVSLSKFTDDDLRQALAVYDNLRDFLHDEAEEEFQRALYFSDNLVVVAPHLPVLGVDQGLYRFVTQSAWYQCNMALRGRALRGGIASGLAYADRTFVTGPAHLAAVQLEERTAGVPRIVLDHDCVNLALLEISESGYSHPTNSPYSSYLLRDSDGRVFVSYLETAWEDAYDYPWEPADVLVKHRTWVEEMLTRNYSTDRVFEKYRWVAAYHNYVCDRWSTLAAQSISEGDRFKVPHAPQHEFTPLVPMD